MHNNDVNNECFAWFDTWHCHRDGLKLLNSLLKITVFHFIFQTLFKLPFNEYIFSLLHLLFQKRAHDHALRWCMQWLWVLRLDSFTYIRPLFSRGYSKSKHPIDNLSFTLCTALFPFFSFILPSRWWQTTWQHRMWKLAASYW